MSISEQKLYTFEEDMYNRRIIAENLTKIIASQNNSIVISLDSEWGTGKTTFVTMWKNMLDSDENYNSKFKTLYFNAWENDYIKDPLLAIFSEMEKQIHEEDSDFEKNLNKVKSKLKPFGKAVVSTGVKLVTAGILNLDGINLGNFNEQELIKLSEKLGELSIKEISVDKTIRAKFKEEMSSYQKEIDKKIIFFIDELDRCRPTFAIELLEVIKHLFNIENIIFILSIDKEQLSHSVTTIYGQGADTLGYLRRFFDLDYKLPKINLEAYINNKNIIFENKYNTILFQTFIKEIFINEKFSLRDIDKAYYYIGLLIPLIEEFNKKCEYNQTYIAVISYLYATLIAIKIKKPNLYKQVIDKEYDVKNIVNEFNIPNLDHYVQKYIGDWHYKPLQQVINSIIKPFLIVNLKSNKEDYIKSEGDEFMAGIRDGKGGFVHDSKFDLASLFNNEKLNIINKLEFINSFERD
ncbi:P-loop NTPase fold protein [Clostridium perfringens]|uniref:KAP family P-loop NTPase fold protein n=1 Tax=Clostridium perfringens TaxID=1502 RepID=UPI002A25BB48|nr:P-loop NTPase fold protein [Clostridium perfringens]